MIWLKLCFIILILCYCFLTLCDNYSCLQLQWHFCRSALSTCINYWQVTIVIKFCKHHHFFFAPLKWGLYRVPCLSQLVDNYFKVSAINRIFVSSNIFFSVWQSGEWCFWLHLHRRSGSPGQLRICLCSRRLHLLLYLCIHSIVSSISCCRNCTIWLLITICFDFRLSWQVIGLLVSWCELCAVRRLREREKKSAHLIATNFEWVYPNLKHVYDECCVTDSRKVAIRYAKIQKCS